MALSSDRLALFSFSLPINYCGSPAFILCLCLGPIFGSLLCVLSVAPCWKPVLSLVVFPLLQLLSPRRNDLLFPLLCSVTFTQPSCLARIPL